MALRVPQSWKKRCKERHLNISYICRSAIFQALQQSEPVLRAGAMLKSKQQAASLWNALQPLVVRTISDGDREFLTEISAKSTHFKVLLVNVATPQELVILGEFLDQAEYAEEILQEVFV